MRRTVGLLLSLSLLLAGSAPAAADEEAESEAASQKAASFSGTSNGGIQYAQGEEVEDGGIISIPGSAWGIALSEMSDPRLNGNLRIVLNQDFHGSQGRVWSLSTRIDNELGSWMGTGRGYLDQTRPVPHWSHQALYRGTGAYEGLTAIVFFDFERPSGYDYHGMVFPGDLPEVPEFPEPAE